MLCVPSDKEVIRFIQIAINILRENLRQQHLVFDEVCNPELYSASFLTILKFVFTRLQYKKRKRKVMIIIGEFFLVIMGGFV
jgi:hypothetical protein